MIIQETKSFKYGLVDKIDARGIPRGAASSSKNWLSKGDHIELRGGQKFLGTSSLQTGIGRATGIRKAIKASGTEILFGTYGKKLKYFDTATAEWIENGSDLLGTSVVDSNGIGREAIFLDGYTSPAGDQLFLNSPRSAGFFKIMVANPGSSTNMYNASKNYKGYIKIDTNSTFLWGRTSDQTGIYRSYIDTQTNTTVTAEAFGTGDGSTKTFNHTLAFKAGAATRTCFAVTVTDGTETFSDNYDGTLTGSLGGTGTINYTSGVCSVTFNTAPTNLQAITTTYQWEDSNTNGITDFTKSATRTAGQGFIFRQDEGGGPIQNVGVYSSIYYCFHLKKTWALTLSADDLTATNLPYRQNVGIPGVRGQVSTGDGIYYIDTRKEGDVKVRLMTYTVSGSQQVIPVPISNNINLNDYLFDQCAGIEAGDFVLWACSTKDSLMTVDGAQMPANNRVLVFNKLWKSWDVLDYNVSCWEIYNNTVVAGDSISNNFLELFSGFDDLGSTIDNFWIGSLDPVIPTRGTRRSGAGLKKIKKLYLEGNIAADQSVDVFLSLDQGDFVKVATISGRGTYVDTSTPITLGSRTLGTGLIGGTKSSVNVYHYETLIPINTDKFEFAQIKFVATGIGYVSINDQRWWDVRFKGNRVPQKYRV